MTKAQCKKQATRLSWDYCLQKSLEDKLTCMLGLGGYIKSYVRDKGVTLYTVYSNKKGFTVGIWNPAKHEGAVA